MTENNRGCHIQMNNLFSAARMKFTVILEGKWTEEEIDMLRNYIHSFAGDLIKLNQNIKNRTVSQICTTLKKNAFDDAGTSVTPVRVISSSMATHAMSQSLQLPAQVSGRIPMTVVSTRSVLGKNAEVTLNMLNATENEVDVESFGGDVKLEFDNTENIPT